MSVSKRVLLLWKKTEWHGDAPGEHPDERTDVIFRLWLGSIPGINPTKAGLWAPGWPSPCRSTRDDLRRLLYRESLSRRPRSGIVFPADSCHVPPANAQKNVTVTRVRVRNPSDPIHSIVTWLPWSQATKLYFFSSIGWPQH